MMPLWKRLGELRTFLFRHHFAKTMTALAALAIFTLFLIFYPATLKMKVEGVIQPDERRNIFARTEGIVEQILVDQGSRVKKGELLLTLKDPDLDLQIVDIEGELKVNQRQLEEVIAKINSGQVVEEKDKQTLFGEHDQFVSRRKNLNQQLELLRAKKTAHEIFSPIDGTVVTWDAKNRLKDLPVAANQQVLAIANFEGTWQTELRIPQNKLGYIAQAIADNGGQQLDVVFRVATNPNVVLHGKLKQIADRADSGQSGVPEFRAIVDADISQLKDLRPGAGVTAKIKCGDAPLGFVWFYQIVDFVRMHVFF
jgi:biotin carboxyl carrier protein